MRPAGAVGRHTRTLTSRPLAVSAGVQSRAASRWVHTQARRCRTQPDPKVAFGGLGGGGHNGGKGLGGDGNGPWDWHQDGSSDNGEGRQDRDTSAQASASIQWKGWQDRVDADPSFRDKVLIEQIIGVAASVLGDMSSRPHWGLHELDFVFSTLVVGSILNFSLMYFLAPTAAGAAGGGFLQRVFTGVYLRQWGAPAGHLFEPGFPLSKRLLNFLYKGGIFGTIGLGAGVAGTSLSNALLALRKRLDSNYTSQNKPPNVALNASTWALHMGISSNLRYQSLNGFDMAIQPRMSAGLFRILTSFLRMFNNALGACPLSPSPA